MTGLWIGLSKIFKLDEIKSRFSDWFPSFKIIDSDGVLEASMIKNKTIAFHIDKNESEFPCVIQIDWFPGKQDEKLIMPVMIELARKFSITLKCNTICDGSGYGDDEAYPGDTIVWKEKRSYLADDYCTMFGDGEGEPVRIEKEIEIDTKQNKQILDRVTNEIK